MIKLISNSKSRVPSSHPNFMQAIIHDGYSDAAKHPAEVVWVEVLRHSYESFEGRILNHPKKLNSVKKGDAVHFINGQRSPYPIMVTNTYLTDKEDWHIRGCNCCGFAELFSPPSDVMKSISERTGQNEVQSMFTTLCGMCKSGVQVITQKGIEMAREEVVLIRNRPSDRSSTVEPAHSRWPAWIQAIFQPA